MNNRLEILYLPVVISEPDKPDMVWWVDVSAIGWNGIPPHTFNLPTDGGCVARFRRMLIRAAHPVLGELYRYRGAR